MFTKVFVAWKKDYGEDTALEVCSVLRELGVEYVFDEPKDCDLAVIAGGDGTLLKYQSALECPMLGINPGKSVGYYMKMKRRGLRVKLRKVIGGKEGKDYFVTEYPRLEVEINRAPMAFLALNDVLVSATYTRRLLDSELKAKGKTTRERNTGILAYTFSGSHAYARSVGAKPFEDVKKIGVAAVAPYSGRLSRGEILLEGPVSVRCLSREGEVCIDGQDDQLCRLSEGDTVRVKKNGKPARIISFSGK